MSENKTPSFLTPSLQKALDNRHLSKEEKRRVVARLHSLDINAQLNGLLSDLYQKNETLIAKKRLEIVDDLCHGRVSHAFNFFNAYTLEAFNFYIKAILTYFKDKLAEYRKEHERITYDEAFELFADAKREALHITWYAFDEENLGVEKRKVYIPTINEPNTRKNVIDYLDPDGIYELDLRQVEAEREEENHMPDIENDEPVRPSNLEHGFRDENNRPYSLDPDTGKIYYDDDGTTID